MRFCPLKSVANRQPVHANHRSATHNMHTRIILLACMLTCSACTLIQRTAELPAHAWRSLISNEERSKPVDPVALQNDLLQFADTFITSTSQALEQLKKPDGSAISRFDRVKLKSRLTTDMLSLVSGSNQVGNLVETLVYIESLRISIEAYWLPSTNNMDELPLLAVLRQREANLREIARDVLTPAQLGQLQAAIEDWRTSRKPSEFDLGTFASFTLVNEVIAHTEAKKTPSSSNVFALLDLDPLAGLDPAARELTETRLFGERALFLGKRMPQLMEYQMELLTMRTSDTPEVQDMIGATTRIATAADRFSQTFAAFPKLIQSERRQWIGDFHDERQGLLDLTRHAERVMSDSARTAESAERAIKTFRQALNEYQQKPKDPAARPFDIREYTQAAEQVESMTLRLAASVHGIKRDIDGLDTKKFAALSDAVTAQTQERGEAMINYAYNKGLRWVLLACLIVSVSFLLTALAYRKIVRKF
jgi:hypothetical protein